MRIKMFQVDAFTEKLFGGNPAAVCLLDNWIPESTMQSIANENNLAETAFLVTTEKGIEIRWFTPTVEVDLCGHATLAAAHVLFHHTGVVGQEIAFHSIRSGVLHVKRAGDLLTLDFPSDVFKKIPTPAVLVKALGVEPMETYRGKTDFMVVLPSEQHLIDLTPDFNLLSSLEGRGVIVTAMGERADFVSRFFAPQSGISEDPVTGSSHTTLIPYWAKELKKTKLTAIQLSQREGHLWCKYLNNRVEISGHAVTYMQAEISLAGHLRKEYL